MPKRYAPSLDHVGFDWAKDIEVIRSKLIARSDCILAALGFVEPDGCIAVADASGAVLLKTARDSLFDDIAGILSWAAAVKMDAGFKAAGKIIATVDAVEKDPSIIVTHSVEPEALGVIARNYQRANEPPGTHSYDIYQDENAVEIDIQQVCYAARRASLQLRAESRRGRPNESGLKILAGLREIFERYNASSGRHSVLTWADGKCKQEEAGPYLTFLKGVIAPLNEFLASLPTHQRVAPISAARIVRKKANLNRPR